MKRIILLFVLLLGLGPAMAQNTRNDNADNIIGVYKAKQGDNSYKIKIVKLTNGTYRGQMIWMEKDRDAKGNKLLDTKNPNKELRTTPYDRVVLFTGLKYNAKKHCWDDTKIYDPQRGMRANLHIEFTGDGRLRVKGSLIGISESVYWTKVE